MGCSEGRADTQAESKEKLRDSSGRARKKGPKRKRCRIIRPHERGRKERATPGIERKTIKTAGGEGLKSGPPRNDVGSVGKEEVRKEIEEVKAARRPKIVKRFCVTPSLQGEEGGRKKAPVERETKKESPTARPCRGKKQNFPDYSRDWEGGGTYGKKKKKNRKLIRG